MVVFECEVLVCKLLVFVGICVIGVTNRLILLEELDGTAALLFCIVVFEVTAYVLCNKGYTECCVVGLVVLDKIYCNGLVGSVGFGGLESVLEVTILNGGFVCTIFLLNVDCIIVAVVFCAGVYGYAVTDECSRVEGDLNVNCGRVLVIRPLILILEELDC